MKKYELTEKTIEVGGRTLHQIRALISFGNVKAGDLGGWIESENNLSHCNDAWVYGDAKVYGNARVYENAKVYGNAEVYGDAKVYGDAWVYSDAKVYGDAWVYDDAKVYDDAEVCGNAKVYGNAEVYGNAWVYGNARVCGDAWVYENAKVYGDAWVYGNARVCVNKDYVVFKNWWSSGRYFTWTRSNNMWAVGCFYGSGEDLIKKAYKDSEKSGREYERIVRHIESILAAEEEEK